MSWFLYLIECADDSVYTGITTDVAARFDEHASGKGARYTRSRKPRAVLASFPLPDRSIASRAEYWVKRLTAAQKRELAAGIRTLESVLPPGMSIDGNVDAAVVAASTRGRKKVNAKNAGETAESAETRKVPKKTAKAVQTAKTPKKAQAAPAAKRAKTGDDAPTKKTMTCGTPDKADKAGKSGKPIKPAAKSSPAGKASGGKPATNGRDVTARAPAHSRAPTAKATALSATPRRATLAKRAKDAPLPAAPPAAAHRKRPARKKQNRAAS
ncbi:GIY-YIG nuclease family protein [Burkholderia anthina]|uniref:GIY-YIG nuclease family protein n=1 Tax=Burkholderia anthina TaxID=179879 RepID=UPI001CF2FA39|nr:GIY-YIG nuclease family protein [Burkholderia anthina]MCA8089910.1 GIY-YIG nuclease family protein [Burkholderia anthina]